MRAREMDWGGEDGTAPEDPGPTQKLLLATIDSIQGEFSIDPDRYYIMGLSMGGYGTWDLITRHPNRWAAAAPICSGGDKSKAPAAKPAKKGAAISAAWIGPRCSSPSKRKAINCSP